MSSYRITRESLATAGVCWLDDDEAELGRDREALEALIPPEGVEASVAAVKAALDAGVSAADVHWALVRAAGLPDRLLRLAACADARRALALVSSPDPRSVAAVDVAERYARGEATDRELIEARDAAVDAAGAARDAYTVYAAACAADAAADTIYAAARTAEAAANAAAWGARAARAADATSAADAGECSAARNASWRESCLTLARIAETGEL